MQFRVGVVVLATILITVILLLTMTNKGAIPLLRRTYQIKIRFDKAPGVAPGTPVRKDGIRIGQVRDVQFVDHDRGVLVTADIDDSRYIYQDEVCKATSSALTRDAALEFVADTTSRQPDTEIDKNEVLHGKTEEDVFRSMTGLAEQAKDVMATFDKAGKSLDSMLTRVEKLLPKDEQRVAQTIDEIGATMHDLRDTLHAGKEVLGSQEFRQAIAQTPGLITKMGATMDQMGRTFDSLGKSTERTFASMDRRMGSAFGALQQNMENILPLTSALGTRGTAMVNELGTSVNNINDLTTNLALFSQKLNDTELYQHVAHVARTIDELTRDLKPILSDARVFSDKIARHPEVLGVRGAIKKDAGLKDSVSDDDETETNVPEARRWPIGGSGRWSIGR